MAYHPYVSVICIHSGVRRYSYVNARSFEHERAWTWLAAGAAERLNLMHCVAVQEASELVVTRTAHAGRVRPLAVLMENVLEKIGVHPHSLQRYFEGLARGEWVGRHTRFTSKPPELPLDLRIPVGSGTADDLLGRGWHSGEVHGRWTAAETAEIFFSVPPPEGDPASLVLEICGHPLRAGDLVTFTLNDATPVAKTIGAADEVTQIPLPGPGTFHLSIAIENPASPQSLGRSDDRRVLGYRLTWLRVGLAPVQAARARMQV
jgi:hypothetical protein